MKKDDIKNESNNLNRGNVKKVQVPVLKKDKGITLREKRPLIKEKISAKLSDSNAKDKRCPYAKKCGACAFTGVPYKEQLEKKQHMMDELLGGFCKVKPIIGMEEPRHYRGKVHHVFGRDQKGHIIAGSYEANSHKVVDIDECLIEDIKSQQIIKTIKELSRSFKLKIYDEDTGTGLLRHILIRRGFKSGEIMVVLVLSSPILPGKNNFVKALRSAHPEISTIIININDADTSMVLGEKNINIYGPGFIRDELCGKSFRISPGSFYQVNPVQTEVLYKKAIEYAGLSGKETVIDAYCGIGTIGLAAADRAKEVIGIELNPDAVKDARINAKENGIKNAKFICADAGEYMEELKESAKADVIFMDPPRSGSTEKFILAAAGMKPKRIVYISCGPETLKRDLGIFKKNGFEAMKIQPVDMFPYTDQHVETVVLLSRIFG